jgi:ABC-type multidrug transport system ATPase subunit
MQEDVMNAFLTVRETLNLAALFQLPSTITDEQRESYVNSVIR